MTRVRGGVYPALTMLVLAAMGCWILGGALNIYDVAPALIAVAMLFASSAGERTSFNAALPIALTAVIVALIAMPLMGGVFGLASAVRARGARHDRRLPDVFR